LNSIFLKEWIKIIFVVIKHGFNEVSASDYFQINQMRISFFPD